VSGPLHAMTVQSQRRFDTAIGELEITATTNGLSRLAFVKTETDPSPLLPPLSVPHAYRSRDVISRAIAQITEYLSGSRTSFAVPLDLSATTDFQRTVLTSLLTVPYGHTVSYRQLASIIEHPNASRAVGHACASNPLPILIPCHRVLRSNGQLGGYLGGSHLKHILLNLENHHLRFSASVTDQVPSRQQAAMPSCSRTVNAAEH
jgi:methylated-DNA-[protein]-cysteine S-methyltransferase